MINAFPSNFKAKIPAILLAAVLAGGMILLLVMWWEIGVLDNTLKDLSTPHLHQTKLSDEILRLDQTLSTSARMSVNTGDIQWRQQYDTALPQLTSILDEATKLAEGSPRFEAMKELRKANDRRVALERKAFHFAEIGELDQARKILDSPIYTTEHLRYHNGLDDLSTLLHTVSTESFATAQQRTLFTWKLATATVPMLMVATFILSLILFRSLRTLRESQRVQEKVRRELSLRADTAISEMNRSRRELEKEIDIRREAEEEITASEKKYRALVETSQAGFVIINDEGKVLDANDRYVALTGQTSLADILGKSILEWTAGYDREKSVQALRRIITKGFIQNFEIDYMDDDGRITPVETHGTIVNNGSDIHIYGLCLDITERRKAERAMQDSEARYRRLIETTETAFVAVDKMGIVLDANQKYVELSGHHLLDEILGHSVVEWTAEHERDRNARAVMQCFDQGWIRDFQVDYVMPDGSFVPIEVNASVMDDPDGPKIHALCRDISERRKAELILKDNEERLKMAFRGGQIGFWDWDIPSGDVVYNEEWAAIIGYRLREIQHNYPFWESRIHPADKAATISAIENHLSGKTDGFEIEHRLQHKDGQWKWVLGIGRISETDGSGGPRRMTGVMIDITRRKEIEEDLAQSEDRFRNVALTSGDWIWQVDTQGRYTYVSDSVTRILGYDPEELIGKTPFDLMPEDEAKRVGDLFFDRVQKHEHLVDLENWNLTKDGERTCMLTNGVPIFDEAGEFNGYFGTDKDITSRKQSEYQLKLFGRVFESALEGITITDAEGKIIAVNQAFSQITGYTAEEAIGLNPRILKSARHERDFYTDMWESISEGGKWEGEIWNRRKSGEAYPEWLSISAIRDEDGHTSHFVAVFHDITETKRKEEQIEHQAYHDALTGLPNRLLLHDRLTLSITRAKRADTMVGILFIDLDNFKAVNDSLGHATGDKLLLEVAARFLETIRESDTVARLGGDEFVVLMDEIGSEDDTIHLAERLLKAMESPVRIDGRDLFTTPSIGIAIYPRDGEETGALIKNADIAMYRAKEQGRNRFNLFTSSMNEQLQRRLELERDMRRALNEKEFFLCYQPKVDTKSGKVVGVEALVRWNRKGEIVSPVEFIPLAEQTGFIDQIGELVVDMALSECAPILKCTDCLRLSVNLSPRQFQQPKLVEMLDAKLTAHGVNPTCLDVEITESSLLTDVEDAILKLQCINRMGVTISVDDFGTGYSSLSYIKRLPVQTLKIDRSFVTGLGRDEGDESIIMTIIQLARNFNMTVVAEGVETEEQIDILRQYECDQIQGYYYSEPVRIDAFLNYFKKTNG